MQSRQPTSTGCTNCTGSAGRVADAAEPSSLSPRQRRCLPFLRLSLLPVLVLLLLLLLCTLPYTTANSILCTSTKSSTSCAFLLLPSFPPFLSSLPSRYGSRRQGPQYMVNEERLGLRNVDPEFAFFDQAQMYVRAGSGGQGAATFKLQNGRQKGAADGGAGGRGGDVVFVCDGKINTLQVSERWGERGREGGRRK